MTAPRMRRSGFSEANGVRLPSHAMWHIDRAAWPLLDHGRLEKRRDAIIHRGRWQFGLRDELRMDWPGDGHG